ncbi:MAG: hypothetical protein HY974_02980 [Candidatus Kerfeldbacteria bacterium]|nr:hypothetical protein [Candidatus Kerfeldbacteria bacterium]
MEEQHQALLRLAIRGYGSVRKTASLHKVSSEFKERIASFANHYLWLLSNYREGRPFNSGTVWQQLRHLCQNKSKRELQQELRSLGTKVRRAAGLRSMVLQQYKLSTDLRAAFRLLCWWAGWIDQRKHTALIVNWYLEAYARAIARRLSRPLWQVKYMTTEEAVAGLKRGVLPTMSALAARRKFSVYVVVREHNGVRDEFITGVSAGRLWRAIFKKQGSEIKGQVASAPVSRLKGVVQVVLDPHRDNFKTGRILVTTMTRPDFVTIMRRASAIVTDEGGITSHAAIIARELGVTCIIGTKTASKILKTGDKVELDLRQGKVRKL